MTVTFPAMGLKGDDTRFQAPQVADRCTEGSSGKAGMNPDCRRSNIFSSEESRTDLYVEVTYVIFSNCSNIA